MQLIPYTYKNGQYFINMTPSQSDIGGEVDASVLVNGTDGRFYSGTGGTPVPLGKNDIEDILLADNIEKQKRALAAQRFALETGGVIEPVSGKTILTDRESQQILDSTLEKIRRFLIPSVQWKCADGWIELNENNIDAIGILVLTHVQTAFAWEKAEQERLGLNA
jgi:hypothetical protein